MYLNNFKKTIDLNKILLKYLSVSYLSIPISLITGFFCFRNIDPYYMGIWTALTVFETYATFMRLGIVNGMNRELPYTLGTGDKELAQKYAQTTLLYSILSISLLIVFTPLILLNTEIKSVYSLAIVVSIIRVGFSTYSTYLSGTFRSEENFNKLSNIQFVVLMAKLFFCPLVLLGFNGFLAYELIGVLTNAILLHYARPMRIIPKFYKEEFIKLFKIGFPLFIMSSLISYIDTIPRLFLVKNSNAVVLGLYSPVVMLLSTVSILPNSLAAYFYPKLAYQFGSSNNVKDLWKKVYKIYFLSFFFLLLMVLIGYFLIDYVIEFFPKYKESLPYLKFSLLVCPFLVFKLGYILTVIIKNYKYMVIFCIIYGVSQIVSLLIFKQYFLDILLIVVYSQLVTVGIMFFASLILNFRVVQSNEFSVNFFKINKAK